MADTMREAQKAHEVRGFNYRDAPVLKDYRAWLKKELAHAKRRATRYSNDMSEQHGEAGWTKGDHMLHMAQETAKYVSALALLDQYEEAHR